jgi:hypothetical protein
MAAPDSKLSTLAGGLGMSDRETDEWWRYQQTLSEQLVLNAKG